MTTGRNVGKVEVIKFLSHSYENIVVHKKN